MIDNPLYNGDYIAQAKAEIIRFSLLLDESLKKKKSPQGFEYMQVANMDISNYPTYNFGYFQKYTDEKLASANPNIYIVDLDEIYVITNKCISKYCQLIEKTSIETEKYFASLIINMGIMDTDNRKIYIFIMQTKFCFQFNKYYKQKRGLVNNTVLEPVESEMSADFMSNKNEIREILGDAFKNISETRTNDFIDHILSYKYSIAATEFPIIVLDISQGKLIQLIRKIRKDLNFDKRSRRHFVDIFSKIITHYENKKPVYFKKATIDKNL
jgi:hypothetical protein